MSKAIRAINALEGFAIPFAANVANNEIGYQVAGRAFCQMANQFMPVITLMKAENHGKYRSTLEVYSRWNPRVVAEASAPALQALKTLHEQVEKQKHTSPFGTDEEDVDAI